MEEASGDQTVRLSLEKTVRNEGVQQKSGPLKGDLCSSSSLFSSLEATLLLRIYGAMNTIFYCSSDSAIEVKTLRHEIFIFQFPVTGSTLTETVQNNQVKDRFKTNGEDIPSVLVEAEASILSKNQNP